MKTPFIDVDPLPLLQDKDGRIISMGASKAEGEGE
jgi:hypothetical protein